MHRLISLAAVSLCWTTMGCGLSQDPEPPHQADSGPAKSDGIKTVAKPTVDRPPEAVCGLTVPIQGNAAKGTSVFAKGGLEMSGIATDPNPATGRFCLDVRLKLGQDNLIEVRAMDPVLGESNPETVTVKQTTCGKDDGQPPVEQAQPQNVALGLKARTNLSPEQGNEGFITDGNAKTWAQFNTAFWTWGDPPVWITIKLAKLTELSSIVVKWRDGNGNGTAYGQEYKVLISTVAEPGDPNVDNGMWTDIKSYEDGVGATNTVDLKSTKPSALHVALWLLHDGNNSLTGWEETYALSELEVWDNPKTSTTPIGPANTCQNLGN